MPSPFKRPHSHSPCFATLLPSLLLLGALSCNRPAAPTQPSASENPARPSPGSASSADAESAANAPDNQPSRTRTGERAVKAGFRNVMFHLTPHASALLESVSGELWPVGKYDMPDFNDKASFELHVENGTISITSAALASILNTHVFVRDDAPMKDIDIAIKDGRFIIKGKLHKGDLPFETAAEMEVNADGRLRLHTEKVKAFHLPIKKVMALFGVELANVIGNSKIPGLSTDKNDLILDLGSLLPPPHIRGAISATRLGANKLTVIYGGGGKHLLTPPGAGNYIMLRGNLLKFGKLTMENADLALLDLDPQDPLDWNQDRYKDQLVEGYSKVTSDFGLRTYVKDFAKLPKLAKQSNSGLD